MLEKTGVRTGSIQEHWQTVVRQTYRHEETVLG